MNVTKMWQQAHFGAVMPGSLQLSCASSDKNRVEVEAKPSSQEGDPMEVWRFCLDDVRGLVHTTRKVTILPFSTVSVHANSSVKGHYVGSCAHGANARSPVAGSSGYPH